MTRRFLFLAVVAASTVGLVLSSCSEKSTKPKPRSCQDCLVVRTSPANVLNNLRVIYSVKDNNVNTLEDAHSLARTYYRELFDPSFKFYFLPGDVPPGQQEDWWGRDDEAASFDSLLTKRALGIISEIQLSWSPGAAMPDNRMDPGSPPALLHPNWKWIHVTSILLDVVLPAGNGYRVPLGLADFYFGPDPADSTLWVITEWWDRQPDYSPSQSRSRSRVSMLYEPTSWGRIKGLFK
jgi:hypothetical protein